MANAYYTAHSSRPCVPSFVHKLVQLEPVDRAVSQKKKIENQSSVLCCVNFQVDEKL